MKKGYSGPILVAEGPSGGAVIRLNRELTLIGKSSQARLWLRSPDLSRFHAAVINDRGLWLRDLSRGRDLAVNGRPVRESVLREGDRVTLGPFIFRLGRVSADPLPPVPRATLVDPQGLEVVLSRRTLLIGRTDLCDLMLKSSEISRVHALLFAMNRTHRLRDLGSRTGVRVNGVAVKTKTLTDGDVIEFAAASYRYCLTTSAVPEVDTDASVPKDLVHPLPESELADINEPSGEAITPLLHLTDPAIEAVESGGQQGPSDLGEVSLMPLLHDLSFDDTSHVAASTDAPPPIHRRDTAPTRAEPKRVQSGSRPRNSPAQLPDIEPLPAELMVRSLPT